MESMLLRHAKLCYYLEEKRNNDVEFLKAKIKDLVSKHVEIRFNKKDENNPFSKEELLDAILCLYDSILLLPEYGSLSQNFKLLVDNIYKGNFVENLDAFTIKISSLELCRIEKGLAKCKNEEDLLHEYFVGSLFLNKLRFMVPNYHITYAGVKLTSNPDCIVSEEDCLGICPCDTEQTVDYILYERFDGVTLSEMLKICTLKDYLSWLIQILLSLELAHLQFGFVHNNLHTDNILIRLINKDMDWIWPSNLLKKDPEAARETTCYIKYFYNGKIYYVKCKSIACIINYELAHVEKLTYTQEGEYIIEKIEDFNPKDYETYRIENDLRFDIYKLVMWTLRITYDNNRILFDQIKSLGKLFGFVYQHELLKVLKDISNPKDLPNLSISEAIEFLQKEFSLTNNILIPEKQFSFIPRLVNPTDLEIIKNYKPNGNNLTFFPNLESIMERLLQTDDIKELVWHNRDWILQRSINQREQLINEINKLITNLNNEIEKFHVIGPDKKKKFELNRLKRLIEAKIELLTDDYLWLDRFKKEFNLENYDHIEDQLIPISEF